MVSPLNGVEAGVVLDDVGEREEDGRVGRAVLAVALEQLLRLLGDHVHDGVCEVEHQRRLEIEERARVERARDALLACQTMPGGTPNAMYCVRSSWSPKSDT